MKGKRMMVEFDYSKLIGLVNEKYRTYKEFAFDLGKTTSEISNKLHGRVAFTIKDILEWSALLDISKEAIGEYFFTPKV